MVKDQKSLEKLGKAWITSCPDLEVFASIVQLEEKAELQYW